MDALYNLSVRLQFTAMGLHTGVASAINTLTSLAQKAAATQQAMTSLGRSLKLLAAGVALTTLGVGLLGFLDSAAQRGAALQTIMTGIQTATNATSRQMAGLQDLSTTIGLHNQMSTIEVAQVIKAETGAGITDIPTLRTMTPVIANLAEVLKMSKGMNSQDSATVGVEFAHLFGAYKSQTMAPLINLLGRALFITPASPSGFENLVSQFAGVLRPLYGTSLPDRLRFQQDAITTAALESQLGQQSRGGTQIASLIARTLGAHTTRSAQQNTALTRLQSLAHMTFFDAAGKFAGVSNALEILARSAAALHNPKLTGQLFKQAFGQVGSRQAGLLADPVTITRLSELAAKLGPAGLPTLAAIQKAYNSTAQGQANQARANWDSLMTLIGVQVVPILTEVTKVFVDLTRGAVELARQHPQLVQFLVVFTAITGAIAAVVGPILMVAGVVGMLSLAFGGLTAVGLAPLLLIIGSVLTGITALTLIITHWNEIVGAVKAGIGTLIGGFLNLLETFGLIHRAHKTKEFYVPLIKTAPGTSKNNPYGLGASSPTGGTNTLGATISVPKTPPKGPPKPIGGGGGIAVYQTFNLHGADHQTQDSLAHHIIKRTKDALNGDLEHTTATTRSRSVYSSKLIPAY